MNDFVKRRMDWLAAVAADRKQRGLPLALAVVLAAKYFNSETGKAWPSAERLAEDLNTDRRNVRRALDQLVVTRWLRCERNRHRGPGRTNVYLMREKRGADAPLKGGSTRPLRGAYASVKGGVQTPRTLEEPERNLRSSLRAREDDLDSSGGREASSRRSLEASRSSPMFNEEHADEASAIARWDHERAQSEYKKFRSWHRDHPGHFMSWSRWCEQGKKLDARNVKRDDPRRPDHIPSRRKDFEAASGSMRWLDRRRAAAEASQARYVSNIDPAMEEIDDD
jgi:hypothetical protein